MISRFLIVAPVAIAVSAIFMTVAAGPAVAATAMDCTATPAQLRAAAATAADAGVARKVLTNVRAGEALCAADNKFEAKAKFAAAAKALGVDPAQLAATTAAAAPAAN